MQLLDLTHRPLVVALQRVLQRRHERLPVAGHGRYAAAVDVDVLEDEDRGHATRETSRPAREVPLSPRTNDASAAPATRRLRLVGSFAFVRGADSSGMVLSVAMCACVARSELRLLAVWR